MNVTSTTHSTVVLNTDFPELQLHASGKVRDIYKVDNDHLLFVATDRISAFDYVLATGIPQKGRVLTQLSLFWFDFLKDIVPNHLVTAEVSAVSRRNCRSTRPSCMDAPCWWRGPTWYAIECVVAWLSFRIRLEGI